MRFLAAILLIFANGAASAEVLNCQLTDTRGTGDWIPLKSRITYDPDAMRAVIEAHAFGKDQKVAGEVVTLNAKRVTLRFQGEGLRSKSGRYVSTMVYRMTYTFQTGAFRVTAKPLGYSNQFKAKGACRPG